MPAELQALITAATADQDDLPDLYGDAQLYGELLLLLLLVLVLLLVSVTLGAQLVQAVCSLAYLLHEM